MSSLRNFFNDNVNSILGAISLHLMIVIAFFWFKLGKADEVKQDEVLIAFNEEILTPPEKSLEPNQSDEGSGDEMPVLDRQTLHNIASNVASKLDPEISTENYEKQVLQELGISSLESPGGTMEKETEQPDDENAIEQKPPENKPEDEFDVPNVLRKDNTTVSYFLEGRWHKYIYIPTYKCQGGGTVVLDIVISQTGQVLSALISENKSTGDPCIREEAYRSALSSQFNADANASTKQLGTMTYVFLPQ